MDCSKTRLHCGSVGRISGVLLLIAGGLWEFFTLGSPAIPQRRTIDIRDFAFEPDTLVAAPGDTIYWINHDVVPHTGTDKDGGWDTGPLEESATGWIVAGERGKQDVYCRFHPSMKGTIWIE